MRTSGNDERFDPRLDDFHPKERKYAHFDRPLSVEERAEFVGSDSAIERHSFWPLIFFEKLERRIKKSDQGITFADKPREIRFGSHRDAALIEWFGAGLSTAYEGRLGRTKFASCILAYRAGVGDNVSQAKSLFDEIVARGDCIAIAMDISKFFDRIDHSVLMANWKSVRNCDRLPKADYRVFERMTRFESVDIRQLRARLDRRWTINGRLCTSQEFRDVVRRPPSLISRNPNSIGIPQGTPISGLLANISMLEFDRIVFEYLRKRHGTYRRYSDDIAILLPAGARFDLVIRYVTRQLDRIGLKLNPDKTETSEFSSSSGTMSSSRPFQYLGFTFDGKKRLIQTSSLNRYYSKMRRGIRAKVLAARKRDVPLNTMYLRELMRRYTHFGRHRNFPRYAYRAAKEMNAPEIRRQLSAHMKVFTSHLVQEGVASRQRS